MKVMNGNLIMNKENNQFRYKVRKAIEFNFEERKTINRELNTSNYASILAKILDVPYDIWTEWGVAFENTINRELINVGFVGVRERFTDHQKYMNFNISLKKYKRKIIRLREL